VSPVRPAAMVELELRTAMAYKERYDQRPTDDPLTAQMRNSNEEEIERLRSELSGNLQV